MKVGGKARKNQKISKIKSRIGSRGLALAGEVVFSGKKWRRQNFAPPCPTKKYLNRGEAGNIPHGYLV